MYKHVQTRLNDVRTRSYLYLYVPCTYHVHTCIYIYRNVHTCMYMFMFSNNCIYHVCQPLYTSIVYTLYIHGSDMSVHVYARWSGFQMLASLTSCYHDSARIKAKCLVFHCSTPNRNETSERIAHGSQLRSEADQPECHHHDLGKPERPPPASQPDSEAGLAAHIGE